MATIQGVYVALFGRPADPAGLAYFNSVTQNGANLNGIGDLASTQEYKDRFAGLNNVSIVNSIYQSLFNRDAEASGLNFFVNALNNGSLNVKNIAIAILDGAQGNDKTIAANKVASADLFTKALDTPTEIGSYVGNNAAAQGRAFLAGVTTTAATQAQADAAVANVVTTSNPGVALTGIALSDVVSPTAATAALKTTSLNDSITLTPFTTDKANSAFTGSIDGGFGTDTVTLTTTGASATSGGGAAATANVGVTGTFAAPTLTNVEAVVVNATGGNGSVGASDDGGNANVFLSLANATSVNTITVSSTVGTPGTAGDGGAAAVKISNALVGSTLNVAKAADNVSFDFRSATGTSDAATLNLNAAIGSGKAVTVDSIENLSLVLGANAAGTIAGNSIANVVVTGVGTSGSTITFSSTTLKAVDASAVTGSGIGLEVSAATTGVTVTGTKGIDSITLHSGDTTDKDVIVYNSANISTASQKDTVTNFQTGEDKIDLKAFSLTGGKAAITTYVNVIDNASFGGNAVAYDSGTNTFYADTNNDGKVNLATDLAVTVTGAVAIGDVTFA